MSNLTPRASAEPSNSNSNSDFHSDFDSWNAAYSHQLTIAFTGSGKEYARMWLWDSCWVLLTLGLYYPWAWVRKKRYFCQHTLIGGRPLDFDASPLCVLLFFVGCLLTISVLGWFSEGPLLGFIGVIALSAIVTPLLLRALQRAYARHLLWGGLRCDFHSTKAAAYYFLAPASLVMLPEPLIEHIFSAGLFSEGTLSAEWETAGLVLGIGYTIASSAWVLWLIAHYVQGHKVLGPLKTQFIGSGRAYYGLVAQLALILCWLFLLTRVAGATDAGALWIDFVLTYFVYKMLFAARFQNLIWNRTRRASLGFHSALPVKAMAVLVAKNTFLIVLTLGFYTPYAVIAVARLRLEAITVGLAQDPADWLPNP